MSVSLLVNITIIHKHWTTEIVRKRKRIIKHTNALRWGNSCTKIRWLAIHIPTNRAIITSLLFCEESHWCPKWLVCLQPRIHKALAWSIQSKHWRCNETVMRSHKRKQKHVYWSAKSFLGNSVLEKYQLVRCGQDIIRTCITDMRFQGTQNWKLLMMATLTGTA